VPPYFEVKTPRRAARLKLEGSFVVVGRSEPIPIFHDDPSLSREHAALVVSGGVVRVKDLGSKNRVFVNGKAIEKYAEVPLEPGDTIKVGATTLTLRAGDGKAKGSVAAKPVPSEAEGPSEEKKSAPSTSEDEVGEARIDAEGEAKSEGSAATMLEVPKSEVLESDESLESDEVDELLESDDSDDLPDELEETVDPDSTGSESTGRQATPPPEAEAETSAG
jgi:pSer/pThr/pTyr-binding forkhead associated (FHA) protein